MLLIVMVEKLRLVDGHVHRRRTLRLAALAGQAHLHAFADGFVGKTAGEDLSVDGLEEHVNAPARGESFIARGLERRTHGAGVQLAAFANADAAREGAADAAIGAEVEHGWNLLRAVARHAQERVERMSIDDDAGVHAALGIEDVFEFAENFHHLRAEHFGQQLGARDAVAVFAGVRAAELGDQVAQCRAWRDERFRCPPGC